MGKKQHITNKTALFMTFTKVAFFLTFLPSPLATLNNQKCVKPYWLPFPGTPLRYFSDGGRGVGGGPTEVHALYPKNLNFRISLPKKIPNYFLGLLAYQKLPTLAVNYAYVIVDLS